MADLADLRHSLEQLLSVTAELATLLRDLQRRRTGGEIVLPTAIANRVQEETNSVNNAVQSVRIRLGPSDQLLLTLVRVVEPFQAMSAALQVSDVVEFDRAEAELTNAFQAIFEETQRRVGSIID